MGSCLPLPVFRLGSPPRWVASPGIVDLPESAVQAESAAYHLGLGLREALLRTGVELNLPLSDNLVVNFGIGLGPPVVPESPSQSEGSEGSSG